MNLEISNPFNFVIENSDSSYSKYSRYLANIPHAKILNNLIIFLYKKLTPFLFQEVKNYLNTLYTKYKNEQIKNKSPTISPHELFFNINRVKNLKDDNICTKKHILYPSKDKKNINYQNGEKIYIPKSEQKKKHSSNNKYSNLRKKSKNINLSHINGRKYINEITSIKTQKTKNSSKSKTHFHYKRKKNSQNNSKNNSISNSNQIINTNSYNYKSNEMNKKVFSNIFFTKGKYNNKNYLLNKKNKIHSSYKNKNRLTKSHPLLNQKILYQLSFNNNDNNTYFNKNCINNSSKKNNLQINQCNYEFNYYQKNIRMQNPIINLIKSTYSSNKSNSHSILNKNNNLVNIQKPNFMINNFDLYNMNIINGGNNKNINEDNINMDINNKNKTHNEEKRNSISKKYKLLNEEMMKKIKNTIDDNLKIMFNFSYENFLSKES